MSEAAALVAVAAAESVIDVKLLIAVIGKFLDQPIFPRHDFGEVEPGLLRPDAPSGGVLGQVHDFSRVEQRFGRHTATQDAEPAHFLASLDHHRAQSGASGRPRRRIAPAPPAEDRHLEIELSFAHVKFKNSLQAHGTHRSPQ